MYALVALLLVPPASASSDFGGWSFYMGDPHAHSGVSGDGWSSDLTGCYHHVLCGAFAELFDTAASNGLDWVGMSDHTNGEGYMADDDDYHTLIQMALDHDDEGTGLLVVPAGEVWFDAAGVQLGHKNLLLFGSDAQLEGFDLTHASPKGEERIKLDGCDDIGSWMDDLTEEFGNAVLVPHHPAMKMPMHTDWDCHTEGYEVAVETYSHFGNSLGGHIDWDPPPVMYEEEYSIHSAMDPDGTALKLGFFGGSDFHGSTPGELCTESDERHYGGGSFTVAMVEEGAEFDRPALYDAIVARRTLSTTGPLVPLTVEYTSASVDAILGEEVEVPGGEELEVRVRVDPAYADTVIQVYLESPDEALVLTETASGVWTTTLSADEDLAAWYYAAVQVDGPTALGDAWCDDAGDDDSDWIWASPTWFEVVDHDDDGDGVSWADGDCDDGDATIHPDAVDAAWDGIDVNCGGPDTDDFDGDGFAYGEDCDDTDDSVVPYGADAWYDGVDSNCDGRDDFDQDFDGFQLGEDCDDTDAAISPAAEERWYDGIDTDCDGASDYDQDGDGHDLDADCDDTDASIHPAAPERWYDGVDADCDGASDYDLDGDGYDALPWGDDCADSRRLVHPDARDLPYDGIDSDCDAGDDYDLDGDGQRARLFGGPDCDDRDSSIYAGAPDTWYDGIDSNCKHDDDFDRDGDGHRPAPYGDDPDDGDARYWTSARR